MTTTFALSKVALFVALAAALPVAATAAAAEADATTTVWRCGGVGRTVYGDAPCAGGRVVEAADPRTAAQVAQGRSVLAADLRRGEALRRERLERERLDAAHAQRVPASLSAPEAPLKPEAGRRAVLAKADRLEQEQAPKASRPKLARAQRPPSSRPAADGTWQATAAASPRAPG